MLATTMRVLALLAMAYSVLVVLAWVFQERLAFPGPSARFPDPARAGVPDAERVSTVAGDGVRLEGWYLPPDPRPEDGRAPGLLWFTGNAEAAPFLGPVLADLRPPGMGVLVLDYRGYGESAGRPTEAGLYLDGETAWRLITERSEIDPERVAVYGRSLGSMVALHVATNHPVAAVVLEAPFTDARDMARRHYPILPRFILRLRMNNLERAGSLEAPLLVFHGTRDEIVPFWMGQAVTEAGRGTLVPIEGGGHNDAYFVAGASYRETMHRFLGETLQ